MKVKTIRQTVTEALETGYRCAYKMFYSFRKKARPLVDGVLIDSGHTPKRERVEALEPERWLEL